jgi:hypothetical protein
MSDYDTDTDVDSVQDHLGLTTEMMDPYPATQEAWARSTVDEPSDTTSPPADVRQDVANFAAAPTKVATQVRQVAASDWAPNGYILADGVNSLPIASYDPYRARLVISNHSTGDVFISPDDTRAIGFGSLMIPGVDTDGSVHEVELRTTRQVYLYTQATYVAGSEPIQVQCYAERYG